MSPRRWHRIWSEAYLGCNKLFLLVWVLHSYYHRISPFRLFFVTGWAFCQLKSSCSPFVLPAALLRHVWGSCTRTWSHSVNCRLVCHTPHHNRRQDDCGFIGQRSQRCRQKQTKTVWQIPRLTSVDQNKYKHRLEHLGLKSCLTCV